MTDLSDLISRVEKASDGDRELDEAIALTLNIYVRERRGKDRQYWFYKVGGNDYERRSTHRYAGSDGLPFYTASLDAARSIDPAALCVFASDIGADGLPMVKVVTDTSTSPVIEYTGIAATLELAWCTAILRARQAMQVEALE